MEQTYALTFYNYSIIALCYIVDVLVVVVVAGCRLLLLLLLLLPLLLLPDYLALLHYT